MCDLAGDNEVDRWTRRLRAHGDGLHGDSGSAERGLRENDTTRVALPGVIVVRVLFDLRLRRIAGGLLVGVGARAAGAAGQRSEEDGTPQ